MEDRKMNEKESLDLIAQMIRNTQNRLEANIGIPFLIWGYSSVAMALAIWYLTRITGMYQWNLLWFALVILIWPLVILWNRNRGYTSTFIDRILRYLWVLTCIAILIACSLSVLFYDLQSMFFSALLFSMSATLSGLIVKVKSVAITSGIAMFLSPVVLFFPHEYQLLGFAFLFVVMSIIPGHILNYQSKRRA